MVEMRSAEWLFSHCSHLIDIDLGSLHPHISAGEVYAILLRLREAERDAVRYRWLRDIARHEYDVDDFFGGSSDSVDGMIDKAMKEKGDE